MRKSPSESATFYNLGTKKIGNDGNIWIIVETSNNIKRWKLFKKTKEIKKAVKNIKQLKKVKEPLIDMYPFYGYLIFMARVMLLHTPKEGISGKSYPISKIAKDMKTYKQIMKQIQKINEPINSLKFFLNMLKKNNNIIIKPKSMVEWINDYIVVQVAVSIKKLNEKQFNEDIEFILNSFGDGASDGYLEGNAKVYETPKSIYEVVFEHAKIQLVKDNQVYYEKENPPYWKIRK